MYTNDARKSGGLGLGKTVQSVKKGSAPSRELPTNKAKSVEKTPREKRRSKGSP